MHALCQWYLANWYWLHFLNPSQKCTLDCSELFCSPILFLLFFAKKIIKRAAFINDYIILEKLKLNGNFFTRLDLYN